MNSSVATAHITKTETKHSLGRFVILPKCKGCKNCSSLVEENIMYDTVTGKCIICQQPIEDAEVTAFMLAHYGCPNEAFRDKADVAEEQLD